MNRGIKMDRGFCRVRRDDRGIRISRVDKIFMVSRDIRLICAEVGALEGIIIGLLGEYLWLIGSHGSHGSKDLLGSNMLVRNMKGY